MYNVTMTWDIGAKTAIDFHKVARVEMTFKPFDLGPQEPYILYVTFPYVKTESSILTELAKVNNALLIVSMKFETRAIFFKIRRETARLRFVWVTTLAGQHHWDRLPNP
jgi:hypothetical protein